MKQQEIKEFCNQYYGGKYSMVLARIYQMGCQRIRQIGYPNKFHPFDVTFSLGPLDIRYGHFTFYLRVSDKGEWCLEYGEYNSIRSRMRKSYFKNQKEVRQALGQISELPFQGNRKDFELIEQCIKECKVA